MEPSLMGQGLCVWSYQHVQDSDNTRVSSVHRLAKECDHGWVLSLYTGECEDVLM
jgi:hypothetical protein